jgi:hypothetical protein
MEIIKSANVALRFLLELCALAALGYWGFKTGKGPIMKTVLGIGAPLLTAVVWATFGSPGASFPLSGPLHLIMELFVFGLPAVALYAAGRPALAGTFGLVVLINRLLMYVWGQ